MTDATSASVGVLFARFQLAGRECACMDSAVTDDEPKDQPADATRPPGPRFKPPIRREPPEPSRVRGMVAIEQSRAERHKLTRPPLRVAGWFLMTTAVALVLFIRHTSNELERKRQALMARQRAVEAELGPRWYPIRDGLVRWTRELATGPDVDLVDPDLASFPFRDMPGLYLRLRADQATSPEGVRLAAGKSLRDGFTACLMRTPTENPLGGAECAKSIECATGQLCNEFNRCAKPGQPFNVRLAYKALFALTPEWVREVQDASSDLRLRGLEMSFDEANRLEFPVAIDLLTRAKFALLVVDERPAPASVPAPQVAPLASASAGPAPSATPSQDDLDAVAGKTFPSRVGVVRISDGKVLLRLRRDVQGELMGAAPVGDVAVAAARARNAQSCALALEVRRALGDTAATTAPPALDSSPPVSPSASGVVPSATGVVPSGAGSASAASVPASSVSAPPSSTGR